MHVTNNKTDPIFAVKCTIALLFSKHLNDREVDYITDLKDIQLHLLLVI
jgi:hypothetical protein